MKTLHRILLALALVVSATLFAPAGPAQAGPTGGAVICFDIYTGKHYPCGPAEIPIKLDHEDLPWVGPECHNCPPFVDLRVIDPRDWLTPDDIREVLEGINHATQLLVESRFVAEDKLKERLWQEAGEVLLASAKRLGDAEVELVMAGYIDLEKNESYEHPATASMGEHLLGGIQSIQNGPDSMKEGLQHLDMMIEEYINLHQG